MKWKGMPNVYGLRARLMISLALSVLICIITFAVLHFISSNILENHFEKTDFKVTQTVNQVSSLQEFIDENNVSNVDFSSLKDWEKKQPLMLMEIYKENTCIYSSYYDELVSLDDVISGEFENMHEITIGGEKYGVIMYSDFEYQYYILGNVIALIISLVLFVALMLRSISRLIRYIRKLEYDVQILEGGNLEYEVSEAGNDELTDLARSMNRMRYSFKEQMETEQNLHNRHKKLITEMSHDIRTPLTGILLYTEIIGSHKYESDEELKRFVDKIDTKAHHMKELTDHLFEYALDKNIPDIPESVSAEHELSHRISDFIEELKERGFKVNAILEWEASFIAVKAEHLNRIMNNILSNILKYARKDVPVQIETVNYDGYTGLVFSNTVDTAPSEEMSTGIGIESIISMMNEMGGRCIIEQTESVFEITVLFPKK